MAQLNKSNGEPVLTSFMRVGGASCTIRKCMALPPHMRDGTREVHALRTDVGQRGRGFATTLMHKVCRQADEYNVTLVLFVDPFLVDKGESEATIMGQDALEAWYCTTFGFQKIQQEPMMMARAPGATPRVGLRLAPITRALIEKVK